MELSILDALNISLTGFVVVLIILALLAMLIMTNTVNMSISARKREINAQCGRFLVSDITMEFSSTSLNHLPAQGQSVSL